MYGGCGWKHLVQGVCGLKHLVQGECGWKHLVQGGCGRVGMTKPLSVATVISMLWHLGGGVCLCVCE